MKRFIVASVFVALALGCTANCYGENKHLKLALEINENGAKGSVPGAIFAYQNKVYFFDEKGVLCKTMNPEGQVDIQVSSNRAYVAISRNHNVFRGELALYDFTGKMIWNRTFPEMVSPVVVATDGKRVLAGCYSEEGDPTLKCLNENASELVSLNGYCIEDTDRMVSEDCRFWICQQNVKSPPYWRFFGGDGKEIRKQKVDEAGTLSFLANNGQYLMLTQKGDCVFDFNGKSLGIYKEAIQSKKGESLFFAQSTDQYVFLHKGKKAKIEAKLLEKTPMLCGMASDGSFILFRSVPQKDKPSSLLFIFSDGVFLEEQIEATDRIEVLNAMESYYLRVSPRSAKGTRVYLLQR